MAMNQSNTFFNSNENIKKNKQSICLNMIVKNEESNIENCLTNLVKYIDFNYWVICDTGSNDNTIQIIKDFFSRDDISISGELLQHKWVNFAHNRTLALENAYNKSDYVLIFDADDLIEGKFILPETLTCDKYNLKFGETFFYYRPCLVTNRKQWEYVGILHEYISLKEDQPIVTDDIDGDYFINFGTHGCRSKDPNKYLNDAILLENAYNDPSLCDTSLKNRYAFYCANSYYDSGNYERALHMYKIVLDLDNWNQEKFYSCMRIGNIYMSQNNANNAIEFWTKSFIYDQERIETIILLMKHFYNKSIHYMVNALFHQFLNIVSITNEFKNVKLSNKLFCNYYNLYMIHYYNSISAYYVKDYKNGYESCLYLINNDHYTSLSIDNLQFYIQYVN